MQAVIQEVTEAVEQVGSLLADTEPALTGQAVQATQVEAMPAEVVVEAAVIAVCLVEVIEEALAVRV
jgi:hypothetical protein